MNSPDISPKTMTQTIDDLLANGFITEAKIIYHRCKINSTEVKHLINDMFSSDSKKISTTEKGKKLEKLAAYMLDKSGFFSTINHDLKNEQHQLDHVGDFDLPYQTRLNGYGISLSGFLGESKNYPDEKIDVNIVYKVEALKLFTQSGIGCYFARKGFTGSSELAAGKALMKDFFQKYKTVSIIFTDDDWKKIDEYPKLFPGLFFEKIKLFKAMYTSEISDYNKIIETYEPYL